MDSPDLKAHEDSRATKVGYTSNSISGPSMGEMASLSTAI